MEVYDVEVDCPTPDDKSAESGHNFVIWPDARHTGSGIVVFNTRRAAKMVVLIRSSDTRVRQLEGGRDRGRWLRYRAAQALNAILACHGYLP
jgi:hypothetical protein